MLSNLRQMKKKKSPGLFRKAIPAADSPNTPAQFSSPTTSASPGQSSSLVQTPPSHNLTGTPGTLTLISPRNLAYNASSSSEEHFLSDDRADTEVVTSTTNLISNGSNDALACGQGNLGDEYDSQQVHTPDSVRTRTAIECIYQKIAHTKERIKKEQTLRDDNVNEYLKLASNADKIQLQRIKSVFEKKNQKSAQNISLLQKKLESYQKKVKELEVHGVGHRQPREVLRDVGQGLKTVMSKPKEFAHLLKNRFGSADNINALGNLNEEGHKEEPQHFHGSATFTHRYTKYTSDEESSSITSGSGHLASGGGGGPSGPSASPQHPPSLQPLAPPPVIEVAPSPGMMTPSLDFEPMFQELKERREEYQRMADEVEALKSQLQNECSMFHQALQEERYRYERLEEQMNDLIELHQNEIENLKQGIGDMEEKVQYQSEERLRDVNEALENCQTRISRMEHQQHQHLQQLVSLDNLENSRAHPYLLKLINVVLTVLQVVLLLVATIANIVMPFVQTRVRILTTTVFIFSVVMVCRQWPEIIEWGRQVLLRYFPSLPVQ